MISIYINYFNASHIFENNSLVPIQVGKALAKQHLKMIGDDTGDNISHRNPEFCELTGQYYVWKNAHSAEYYGFMHYRRLFDFKLDTNREINSDGLVIVPRPYDGLLEEYGLDESSMQKAVSDFDVFVPHPYNVTTTGVNSVHEQYLQAPYHFIEHLDEAGKIIYEKCPDFAPFFDQVMRGKWLYPNNMFVMKASIFREYCAWLFDILFELDRRIDVSEMKWQEKRAIGYIAERLFSVYIFRLLENPAIKVKHLHRVFISDPSAAPAGPPPPTTSLPVVTVAASTDEAYVQHMAALVSSTLSTASHGHFIDFIILDGGISASERTRLQKLEALHPHCRLSYIDMSDQHLDLDANSYFTRSTFYRLSLPDLLLDREKVLFLDTDMVVLRDITELYRIELGPSLIGAARDLIMKSFVSMGVVSIEEAGALRTARYLAEKVQLKDSSGYFQAGVLLMNLTAMRENYLSKRMTHALRAERYWFLDQDVLNRFSQGRITYIDYRWNSVHIDDSHLLALAEGDRIEYQKTLDDPWIAHFAGVYKPWIKSGHPHGAYYWSALRLTSWYESALFSFIEKIPAQTFKAVQGDVLFRKSISLWLARKIWRRIPSAMRKRLTPFGTTIKRKIAIER